MSPLSATPACPVTGREAKKARTRQALADAAYEIVRDEGIEQLSAEAIAARAGVSRRTFFNYFPTVESVLRLAFDDFFAVLDARLRAAPRGEAAVDSVERMVADPLDADLLDRVIVLGTVGLRMPQARRLIQEFVFEWVDSFARHLRRRHPDLDDVHAMNLAVAIVGAAESTTRLWVRRTGGTLTPRTRALYHDLFVRSIGFLRTGYATTATPKDRS